jgi:histidinol-phosphate phosphatase family protein
MYVMTAYLSRSRKDAKCPAVFLDRDGTIIHNPPGVYLTDPRRLKFYADALQALRLLASLGYRLIVVTNQSGVGRGYMTLARSKAINMRLVNGLRAGGIELDGVYFCPHRPEENCLCRKPERGLVDEALRHHLIDLPGSIVIGDKISDLKLADAIGAAAIFLKSGEGRNQLRKYPGEFKGRVIKTGILAAARWIRRARQKTTAEDKCYRAL